MSPREDAPKWRSAVDRIDRLVTPPANAVVRSSAFADVTAAGIRLESRLRRRVERHLASVWHLLNLPTATDQRSIRARLVAIESRVRDLSDQLEAERATVEQLREQRDAADA